MSKTASRAAAKELGPPRWTAWGLVFALAPTAVLPAAGQDPDVAKAREAVVEAAPADAFTLDELVAAAAAHYPRRREQQLRGEIADNRLEDLDARFLPELGVIGQAAYHTAVPSLPSALGASPPQDQYTLALEADQRLWDGGRTAQEKAVEEAARDLDRAAVDVDFHGWRERVEEGYFRALSGSAELALLHTLTEDLETQLQVLEARVSAGVALAGDRAVLAAELEAHRQRIVEAAAARRAAPELLEALTGRTIGDDAVLAVPDPSPPADLLAAAAAAAKGEGVGRPEMDQARETRRLLQEQVTLAGLGKKPTLSAFAQGGVGRPADQDFFEQNPTPYLVVGLRLRWRPIDWGVSDRMAEIRRLELQVNGSRLETFLTSLSAGLRQLALRIEASRAALKADDRIVDLREVSSHQAAAQLKAGVITPSAYLTERNAEHRARLTREQHRLLLARDTVDFMTTLGTSP